MFERFPPIHRKFPHMLHGGDYNPDQWQRTPNIWSEDIRLMKLAHCNAMSVGIFSWASLEPEEGRFEFGWLDDMLDRFEQSGIYAVLATPSGARPAWLSQAYPEVLRVQADRVRILHGGRHNHCYTSPVYREKTARINRALAERYGDHPSLLLWHVSNEYGGECHCDLCQAAFRDWLKRKFNHDLDALNQAWWTGFWSHNYSDWSQIESPAPHGEDSVHGLKLDWKRFVTDQTVDFFRHEAAPLRELTPDIPVTVNMMGTYPGLNYWKFAEHIDVVSWDSYPWWHQSDSDARLGSDVAFLHDINRSIKGGRPFMLMESTPSMTNWQAVSKLKRPGMHVLSSLQAVAHGSDTVQYFQWRKSRGSMEKFHGAVVDHVGHEHTRVFRDVTAVGEILEQLDTVVGTRVPAEVALIYDWENRWAMEDAAGPRNQAIEYERTCKDHYHAFWRSGIPVDIIDMDTDLTGYKLVVAPMLYMVRQGVGERIEQFVEAGGTFVTTYWSGIVDDNDLCFLGGFPGPLRKVTGVWSEEIDALYDHDENSVEMTPDNQLGISGVFSVRHLCDLIHTETAEVLATYEHDFYTGRPALTLNHFGRGKSYYLAARVEDRFLYALYARIAGDLRLATALPESPPDGVSVQVRTDGVTDYVFVMNFEHQPKAVALGQGEYRDMLSPGQSVVGEVTLEGYGLRILSRHRD